MIALLWFSFEPGTYGWHAVGIVEADQPRAVRSVQRERVGQAVRALLGRLDALDFELDPVALFQMMNASIFTCPVNGQLFDAQTCNPDQKRQRIRVSRERTAETRR